MFHVKHPGGGGCFAPGALRLSACSVFRLLGLPLLSLLFLYLAGEFVHALFGLAADTEERAAA